MFPTRLIRTTSFRLTAVYLALFMLSTLALGVMVYVSVRREILAEFDDRIVEEADALNGVFVREGRDRLAAIIGARGAGGGSFGYGLQGPDGKRLAGELAFPAGAGQAGPARWFEMQESERGEPPEAKPEVVRALATRLADGSTLIVGDEQGRVDEALHGILSAFGWGIGATVALGIVGGLWLSAQFLSRIDAMRLTAKGIMAGAWSRRIPLSPIDDDLAALARTFNRLFDRVEKLMLANKHVSADIAHDLRKPLASILRGLEAARGRDATSDGPRRAIDRAIAEIEGVLDTFGALLRIGQIEAGVRRAAFKPLDLAEIARETAEAFRPAAEDEGKAIVVAFSSALPMPGDKELLTQMIANLLDNALRHTPAGVQIEVAGGRTTRGVRLSIADNGPGVGADELNSIFERFYRGDPARASGGSGLGLSLVDAIAELHELECSASDNHPGLRITLVSAAEGD